MTDKDEGVPRARLPQRTVTVNMLVAHNMAELRKAAGLTQRQLGELLGMSEASVSAAERSWEGKRTREFDAGELIAIARVLGVPAAALLLPPADAGTAVDYVFTAGPGVPMDPQELLGYAVPDFQGESPAMAAARERLLALGTVSRYVIPLFRAAAVTLEKAAEEADRLLVKAGERAEALEREAARERHRQVMGALILEYEALERRLNDLRAFEREYRTRLAAYLEGQLRDLWAGVEDEGVWPAPLTAVLDAQRDRLGLGRDQEDRR